MKRVLLALAACGTPPSQPTPHDETHMPVHDPSVIVTASNHEWKVEVTQKLGARSATSVVMTTVAPTDAEPAPHQAVARAEAWLEIARESVKAGALPDAINAARSGIAVLGHEYRPPKIKDDTELSIGDADDQIAKGALAPGANELVTALDTRVALYFQRYAGEVRQRQ